jgi:hypothetical protein
MCYNIYIALGWFTSTDFDTEIIWQKAIFGGYNSGFNPAMQRGAIVLCSTPTTVDIPDISFGPHEDRSTAVWNLLVNL